MTTATLGDSGIVLNGIDAYGVTWALQEGSDLWGDSPAPREVSGDRATAHGTWSATEFYGPRAWNPSLLVKAPDHATLHHARGRLDAAVGLKAFTVVGTEPFYGTRQAAYRRNNPVQWTERRGDDKGLSLALASLSLVADDPMIRGAERTATTGAPSSVGGLTWPTTWPATWSAAVTSGVIRLANDGSQPSSVLWRIDGPITDPYLIDIDTGAALRTTLTLQAGQWLTIDTATHRVLANGDPNASRRDRLYGEWFDARPGTQQVQFGGSSPGPGALLTATYRPTWI